MAQAGPRWRFAVMQPGDHPMRRLARALIEQAGLPTEGNPEDALGFLIATLRRGPLGLVEALAEHPAAVRGQSSDRRRSVRGDLPLPPRGRPRRSRRLRLATARLRAAAPVSRVRRHHHALRFRRRLRGVQRFAGGDQREPVPHAAADTRSARGGDRRPGARLRRRHRAGSGGPAPQRNGCRPGPVASSAAPAHADVDETRRDRRRRGSGGRSGGAARQQAAS